MIMIFNYVAVLVLVYGIITGLKLIADDIKEISKKSKK